MRAAQTTNNELQVLLKAVGYIKTHWWLLLAEALLIYGYNLFNYSRTPPVYASDASLLIDNSKGKMYRTYMLGNNRNEDKKRNLVHLLNSHDVFQRLKTALTDYYNEEGRPRYLRTLFPEAGFSPNHFRQFINLTWDAKSDIYNINCTGPNPDAAHAMCLVYMNTIHDYYPEIGQREDMMKREFLSRQISSETREIGERENALSEFQKLHPEFIDFLAEGGKEKLPRLLRESVRKLKNEIEDNRSLRNLLLNVPSAKRGEHTSLKLAIEQLTRQIGDLTNELQLTEQSSDPSKKERLDSLNAEIAQASARLATLNEKETDLYLKAPIRVDDARGQIAKLEFDYRVKYTALHRAEADLEEANRKIQKFQSLFLQYDRLTGELAHHRTMLDNLYKREQRTEIELSAGQAEIFRLREPSRNDSRVAPFITSYLYRSLSLTIFAVALSIILLMALVPRLDSEAEVLRLNLPVIGKVPSMRQTGRSVEDIPSFGLEHLKIMHYRILRETKDVPCPVIVVSSPNAREGKSTVVHSLAMTSQSSTRRTLLIDGDMLTLRPYKFAGVQEDQTLGLKSVLVGDQMPDPKDLIVHTTVEGVSYMPRGERIDPTQLHHNLKSIEGMIKQLRTQYDLILIDTPPLFASNLAHQWSGMADLIVLVARMYVTRPKDILEAIQTCKVFSKAPVGLALNCVPLTSAHRRASNYYFSRKKTKTRLAA
jgi:Mrp family chromosome partitioning ATPase